MKYILGLLCLLLGTPILNAQLKLQAKTEHQYRYSNADSVLMHQKERRYDETGRLTYRKEYYYGVQGGENKLWKEESSQWEAPILTTRTTMYHFNQSPVSERIETNYIIYSATPDSSKFIWSRKYNNANDLAKEDTCTFNDKQQLIQKCTYDFQGSTSLMCDKYDYNRHGKLKRLRTYVKWTTINILGKVVTRQTKRLDYRYKYSGKGLYMGYEGKNYATHNEDTRKYDEQGRPTLIRTTSTRKHRTSKKDREKDPKLGKYVLLKDINERIFVNGMLTEELVVENSHERRKVKNVYQDTLLISHTAFTKGDTKQEERIYTYNAQNILTKRLINKYDDKGNLRYELTATCDAKGNILREEQKSGGKLLSILEFAYDAHNNPTVQQLYTPSGYMIEKVVFTYKYY